jgi:hypothetical protein
MKDITSWLNICPPGRLVWNNHLSSWAIEFGYVYTEDGQKRFFKRDDLKNFLNKNNEDYQEYQKWRIQQNEPIGNENQEFYDYYLEWLRDLGRELSLTRPKQPF